ncbi:hypothetical protein BH11PLA1_BH11PLA1_08740 [soil metagenome]
MFVIREAHDRDIDDLLTLAKQTYFINLPPDRDIIADKVEQSVLSFQGLADGPHGEPSSSKSLPADHLDAQTNGHPADLNTDAAPQPRIAVTAPARSRARAPRTVQEALHGAAATSARTGHGAPRRPSSASGLQAITGRGDLFLLVLENSETGSIVGTSQVIAHMGGPGHPRFFMSLARVSHSSRSLGLGWSHLVGRIGKDETGPTEIGGLILNHAFRGHPQRLGRLLSFARFHLMGLHRARFADRVVAEMLGPIKRDGANPFYEKFTRHFVTRAFADVYKFSQTSREFLESLMPAGDMYLSILDPEVAHAAGDVSDDTRPARALLERLGFAYHDRIDPLDGGPHLEAMTDEIGLVSATQRIDGIDAAKRRSTRTRAAPRPPRANAKGTSRGSLLVSALGEGSEFRLVQCEGEIENDRALIPADAAEALDVGAVHTLGATRIDLS